MSLSGALSNAMSGLTANAHSTSVVSSNIANALTETYGRRSIVLASDTVQSSGGVKVANVARFSDPVLAHQKRLATADLGQSGVFAGFASELERLWGSVDTVASVAADLTRFEASLLSAAADPSSETRLRAIALDAGALVASIRSASDGIQQARSRADQDIAATVDDMNLRLQRIEHLNDRIATATHLGQDRLGLLDQRDAELEAISEFVPLHVIERESGAVAVFTKQGKTLLDGRAVTLGFQKQGHIQPHMTLDNTLLSGLVVNGEPVATGRHGAFAGGALAALFDIRDVAAVDAQSRLDAVACDLIDRFGESGPDATILTGTAGIFTDGGFAFAAGNETGISGRLKLNATLDTQSDELWRWRDGLYATAPGDSGASTLIASLQVQISQPIVPNSSGLGASPASLVDHVQHFGNHISSERARFQAAHEVAQIQHGNLKERAASHGVNSDQELQKLIELEKSYAANARVVRVVDEMLDELLRM